MNKCLKRFISCFLAFSICFLNIYFSYITVEAGIVDGLSSYLRLCNHFIQGMSGNLVDENGNYVPVETLVNGDLYGRGKSWDELTLEQKAYRATDTYAYWSSRVDEVICDTAKVVYKRVKGDDSGADSLLNKMRSDYNQDLAVLWQAQTVDEALVRKAGLGDLLESKDFVPAKDLEKVEGSEKVKQTADSSKLEIDKDLLNKFQEFLDGYLEGKKIVYFVGIDDYAGYIASGHSLNLSEDSKGYANYARLHISNIVNEHGFCWVSGETVYWLDGNIQDYYVFISGVLNQSQYGGNLYSLSFKSKSGEDFYVNHHSIRSFMNQSTNAVTDSVKSTSGIINTNAYLGYDRNRLKTSVEVHSSSSQVSPCGRNSSGHMIVFNSFGDLTSEQQYGIQEPAFIQDPRGNIYHNDSYIGSYDDSHHYNYNYFINQVDGDPSALTDEKIMEIFDSLQDIADNTDESNSWLSKIYDKLKDIEDKIDSGGGGVISDIADFVHWSELQLKLDAIIDNLTSIRKDVDDISDNQSDMDALLNKLDQESQGLANKAKSKFPFCIPWDMLILYKSLEAMPQVPTFNWTLSIPSWHIEEEFTIDLSKFEIVAKISRYFFDIIFFMALCKLGLSMSGYSFSIEKT